MKKIKAMVIAGLLIFMLNFKGTSQTLSSVIKRNNFIFTK